MSTADRAAPFRDVSAGGSCVDARAFIPDGSGLLCSVNSAAMMGNAFWRCADT